MSMVFLWDWWGAGRVSRVFTHVEPSLREVLGLLVERMKNALTGFVSRELVGKVEYALQIVAV